MWLTQESKDLQAIDELEKGSDRSVGVIAGALIDARLSEMLRRDLRRDDTGYSARVRKNVFDPEGPLGTFGAKINLAYLMGYFTADAHSDLQALKKIRNLFAHYREHDTFDTDQLRTLCSNFRLIDDRVRPPSASMKIGDGERIPMDSVGRHDNFIWLSLVDSDRVLKTPRGRFISTAKLFCAAFEINERRQEDSEIASTFKKPYL